MIAVTTQWIIAIGVCVAWMLAAVFIAGFYIGQAVLTREQSRRDVRSIQRRHFAETGRVLDLRRPW